MADSATLTAASPTDTFDTTAGTLYTIGATGHFGGGQLLMEVALPTTATRFDKLAEPSSGAFFYDYRAVGSKLKLTLMGASSVASVNVELSDAV